MLSVAKSTIAGRRSPKPPVLTAEFLDREIARVGATLDELRAALAFDASDAGFDPRAYEALSPRLRRLVDLVAVAGHSLTKTVCDSPQMGATAAPVRQLTPRAACANATSHR